MNFKHILDIFMGVVFGSIMSVLFLSFLTAGSQPEINREKVDYQHIERMAVQSILACMYYEMEHNPNGKRMSEGFRRRMYQWLKEDFVAPWFSLPQDVREWIEVIRLNNVKQIANEGRHD